VDADEEFRWLFVNDYPSVVRTTYLVLHDHARAEEIAQDAFVQLLRHWSKVGRYESPSAWLRRVAIRLAVKEVRRDQRRLMLTRRDHHETPRSPATEVTVEVDEELVAAIRTLSPQQRSVVVLFYYEDRPMDQIAEILGCTPATGWVHLHKARRRLGALLQTEVHSDVD
jgi:RNA polymerase sigma factor (sigma-70 family)